MKFKKSLKKTSLYLIIGICLILIGFLVFSSNKIEIIKPISSSVPTPISTASATFAKVARVIDGDTIVIETGQHIRYIGMNTPELESNECFAAEAAEINKNLVLGKEVRLEKDISDTDKYGRLLRYVYLGNLFIDDELIKDGAAKVETVPPDVKYESEFVTWEKFAKVNKLGLWGKCTH